MSFILKLGGGGGSTKTLVTSSGQAIATHASIFPEPIVPESTVGKYFPLSTRPVSLPFPAPKPTFFGGGLFGGRFSLPQPTGLVQPYRPVTSPFAFGGVQLPSMPIRQAVTPVRQAVTPIAQPAVPVVTEETVQSSSGGSPNTALWQGGLLLSPLLLGWLFGSKTIRHRGKSKRGSFRRLRRPSFRRLRRVRRRRR